MRRIYNGKKYDTETAELICPVSLNGVEGHLFRKKNGFYFIWEHAHYDEELKLYMGDIIDIEEPRAKNFAESALTVDEYEYFFGKVEE